MTEKKFYTAEEIAELSAKAEANAKEHFRHGLNCGECVFKGFLDLGISELAPETVRLASGMGGGIGFTKHLCGAVNAGLLIIGSRHGRPDPYARPTFEERVDELHHEGTGIYPRHAEYVRQVIAEYGTLECYDLCFPFDQSTKDGVKARARNCQKLIGFCARIATEAALKD